MAFIGLQASIGITTFFVNIDRTSDKFVPTCISTRSSATAENSA